MTGNLIAASWRLIYEVPLGIVASVVVLAVALGFREQWGKRKGKTRYLGTHYGHPAIFKKVTHVHPRQQRQGKRIVFIPGVGYRHVQSKTKRKR